MEKKRTIKFIAFALAALVLFGVGIAAWTTKGFGAFESKTVQQEPGAGGMVLGESRGNGIRLTAGEPVEVIEPEESESEASYIITVTPTPADAHDTYAWTSTDDESVRLTPSNGGKTCKVECLKAFGTQITLTCTSESNPDITASLTVDYVKRISSVNVSLSPASIVFGSTETSYTVTATPVWGTGTIQPENFTVTGGTLKQNLVESPFELAGLRNSSRTAMLKDFEFTGSTFSVASPYDAFLNYQFPTLGTNNWAAPTESQLETAVNNEFLNTAEETTGDGVLTIKYSYSYGDVIAVTNATASINVEFDVTRLVINATDITLNENELIF